MGEGPSALESVLITVAATTMRVFVGLPLPRGWYRRRRSGPLQPVLRQAGAADVTMLSRYRQ